VPNTCVALNTVQFTCSCLQGFQWNIGTAACTGGERGVLITCCFLNVAHSLL
jgi:hypothetical protein